MLTSARIAGGSANRCPAGNFRPMPIRQDLRHFYGRVWRTVTRPRILARAGNQCEACEVPNSTDVTRIGGCWLEEKVTWAGGVSLIWHDVTGAIMDPPPAGKKRRIRVVLTIAHLNHTAGDDGDENLKAWCQWCHLNYDKQHHAETRGARKDLSRPLLVPVIEAQC